MFKSFLFKIEWFDDFVWYIFKRRKRWPPLSETGSTSKKDCSLTFSTGDTSSKIAARSLYRGLTQSLQPLDLRRPFRVFSSNFSAILIGRNFLFVSFSGFLSKPRHEIKSGFIFFARALACRELNDKAEIALPKSRQLKTHLLPLLADELARPEGLLIYEIRQAPQLILLNPFEAGQRLKEVHLCG